MVLIKSVNIVDGTGKSPYRGDILLKRDRISAIGNLPSHHADITINGLGMYAAPGFIDIQTSADHYLGIFSNPSLEDFLLQGVTSAIAGHCGSSLAPLLYGSLESIRKWADPNQINVDWHTMREFLAVMKRRKFGINLGTLVGHATIRRALIGEEVRDLTESELNVFQHIVREAMHEGAFGLSTGLGYVHSKNTPALEIETLARVVQEEDGLYATHLRNEEEKIDEAVAEAIAVSERTGVKVVISHFRSIMGFEDSFVKALKNIEDHSEKLDLHFNTYPFDTSIIPIYTLLPEWVQSGGSEVMLENLKDPKVQKKLEKEFEHLNAEEITISHVGRRAQFDYLIGKKLSELAANQEVSAPQALIKLMQLTKLQAVVFVKNVNLDTTLESLAKPSALVTANSAGLKESPHVLKHERFTKTFPRFFEAMLQRKALSIEQSVEKITSVPAKLLGLKNRGVLKEKAYADVTLFSVDGKDEVAIEHVFVNGAHAVKDGVFQDINAGKILEK